MSFAIETRVKPKRVDMGIQPLIEYDARTQRPKRHGAPPPRPHNPHTPRRVVRQGPMVINHPTPVSTQPRPVPVAQPPQVKKVIVKPPRSVMSNPNKEVGEEYESITTIPFDGESTTLEKVNIGIRVEKGYTVSLQLVDSADDMVAAETTTKEKGKTSTVFAKLTDFTGLEDLQCVLELRAKVNEKDDLIGDATVMTVEFLIREDD